MTGVVARVAAGAAVLVAVMVALVLASVMLLSASAGGFAPGAHFGLDAEQTANATIALTVADEEHADPLAVLAMVCAALGESEFRVVHNHDGSRYAGVFQADPANIPMDDTTQQARSFLRGGNGFQAGGAMHLARAHPDMSPGTIATLVEASGEPGAFYDAHRADAERIIAAWRAGASPGSTDLITEAERMTALRQPYLWGGGHAAFSVGGPWDCSGAMSQLMHALGLLEAPGPITSTGFETEGVAGRGHEFTIWTNAEHVFLIVEDGPRRGQAWGTANRAIGSRAPTSGGPTWHMHTTAGFHPRHYPGH